VDRFNRRWAFHDTELSSRVTAAFHALAVDEQRSAFRPTQWHQQQGAAERGQEVKQVWFTGTHSDVGGGFQETGLSDIPLLWMAAQAHRHGLRLDPGVLGAEGPRTMHAGDSSAFRVRPDGFGELHESRTKAYRLSRPLHRPIGRTVNAQGVPDGSEWLAVPAKERRDRDAGYRPPGLERYVRDPELCRLEPFLVPDLRPHP
jgi:hypothetical protein